MGRARMPQVSLRSMCKDGEKMSSWIMYELGKGELCNYQPPALDLRRKRRRRRQRRRRRRPRARRPRRLPRLPRLRRRGAGRRARSTAENSRHKRSAFTACVLACDLACDLLRSHRHEQLGASGAHVTRHYCATRHYCVPVGGISALPILPDRPGLPRVCTHVCHHA